MSNSSYSGPKLPEKALPEVRSREQFRRAGRASLAPRIAGPSGDFAATGRLVGQDDVATHGDQSDVSAERERVGRGT